MFTPINCGTICYTFANVGKTFFAGSVSDYLKAGHRSLDNETVYSYLEKLEKAERSVSVLFSVFRVIFQHGMKIEK